MLPAIFRSPRRHLVTTQVFDLIHFFRKICLETVFLRIIFIKNPAGRE